MKKISFRPSRLLAFFSSLLALTPLLSSPVLAQSNWRNTKCVSNTDVATIQGIVCLVANVASIVFYILLLGGFVVLTVSGVSFMLSRGDAQATSKAANSIKGVVIGFILALASFLIIRFIAAFTGVDAVMNLNLPA